MQAERILVWDRFIRLFHWSLVVLFTTAYLSGEDAGNFHAYAGYAIVGLLAARLLWGFTGTTHARFSDFVRGPGAVMHYFRQLRAGTPQHTIGHNPAGGWMVITLLLALGVTALSGIKLYGLEGHGPLAPQAGLTIFRSTPAADKAEAVAMPAASKAEHEQWEELHEAAANLTLCLVLLHIVAVVISSRLHGENLVKAMLVGFKERTRGSASDAAQLGETPKP